MSLLRVFEIGTNVLDQTMRNFYATDMPIGGTEVHKNGRKLVKVFLVEGNLKKGRINKGQDQQNCLIKLLKLHTRLRSTFQYITFQLFLARNVTTTIFFRKKYWK